MWKAGFTKICGRYLQKYQIDDSDPDDIDDTPGGGDGPGRGGGGGPPGGERSSKPHHKMPRQISPVGGWGQEWKWACVSIASYLS